MNRVNPLKVCYGCFNCCVSFDITYSKHSGPVFFFLQAVFFLRPYFILFSTYFILRTQNIKETNVSRENRNVGTHFVCDEQYRMSLSLRTQKDEEVKTCIESQCRRAILVLHLN